MTPASLLLGLSFWLLIITAYQSNADSSLEDTNYAKTIAEGNRKSILEISTLNNRKKKKLKKGRRNNKKKSEKKYSNNKNRTDDKKRKSKKNQKNQKNKIRTADKKEKENIKGKGKRNKNNKKRKKLKKRKSNKNGYGKLKKRNRNRKIKRTKRKKSLSRKRANEKCIKEIELTSDISKFGHLLKKLFDLKKKSVRIAGGSGILVNKSKLEKIANFEKVAKHIKTAVIYPNDPICANNITKDEKTNISLTYTELLKCPNKIKEACNLTAIKITKTIDRTDCDIDRLKKKVTKCLQENNCPKIFNVTDLVNLIDKCNKLIVPEEEQITTQKKICIKQFRECKKFEDNSTGVLDKCIENKTANNEPKAVIIGELRKGSKTNRQSTEIDEEIDIIENGQFFTQYTTYDETKKELKIEVPEHGFEQNKINKSTTYLLQTGNDKTIFDTRIIIIGDVSYMEDVNIPKDPLTRLLRKVQRNESKEIPIRNTPIKHSEYIYIQNGSINTEARSKLPANVQRITAKTTIKKVNKEPITKEIRHRLHYGGSYMTGNIKMEGTTNSPVVSTRTLLSRWKHRFKESRLETQGCLGHIENAHVSRKNSACYWTVSIGGDDVAVQIDHDVFTESLSTSCCDDPTKFPYPVPCQCSFLYEDFKSRIQQCNDNDKQGLAGCYNKCTFNGDDYTLVGLTGIKAGVENYNCRNQCLYSKGIGSKDYRCFSYSDSGVYCE